MKRREFNKNLAAATAVILSPFSRGRNARAATRSASIVAGNGATQVFNYSDFSAAPNTIALRDAEYTGSAIRLINHTGHNVGVAFYKTQQPPNAFTTQFTFQPQELGSSVTPSGMGFCIQNVVSPPGYPGYTGVNYAGDANMCGYSGLITQTPPIDSVFIKFDAGCGFSSGQLDYYPASGLPSSTGMYFNGGPSPPSGLGLGLLPFNDLTPYGINFYSGHTFQVTIVYDGSVLTMVLLDTATNAQARFEWPLNLPYTTNTSGNYVGFLAGTASHGYFNVLSWSYWSGYNTRLPLCTFSPPPGQYPGAQTVTISYPAGSTCYYTTNGLTPTSSSTQYTGPITVSANAVIQAIAISPGYTDSLTAVGTYEIGTANIINFPSGFSAGSLVPVGFAYLSGSSYRVSDTTTGTTGAVWFPAQVNVQTFSTNFTVHFGGSGQGMCFVIQNNPPLYTSSSGNAVNWSGGNTVVGYGGPGLGYGGLNLQGGSGGTALGIRNSVAIAFDMYSTPNSVGMYTNGSGPLGAQITTGLTFGGNSFNVTLTYDGTTLSISMQNTGGGPTFNHSWTIDISGAVGGSAAYVGFTGGTGGAASIQEIQSWIYTASQVQSTPPVPAAPTNLKVQ